MFTAHIHHVRGSRLGEVEIQAVAAAPRNPAVSRGAAIAERRARRPLPRAAARTAPAARRPGPGARRWRSVGRAGRGRGGLRAPRRRRPAATAAGRRGRRRGLNACGQAIGRAAQVHSGYRRGPGSGRAPGGGRSPYSGGMKILLPDTVPLDPVLPEGWEAVTVDARAEIPAEHHDAAVLVVWGSSRRHLASAAESLEALQLVQSLSAGVDGILAAGFAEHVVIATG